MAPFNMRRFDVHVKTVDGVTQQTVLGAIITLISVVVVLILLFSEFRLYSSSEIVSRMIADNSVGKDSVKLEFDLEFTEVACDRIKFEQEVTRGTVHHTHESQEIELMVLKEPLKSKDGASNSVGCWLHGNITTDKVGGNFKFVVAPSIEDVNKREKDIADLQQRMAQGLFFGGNDFGLFPVVGPVVGVVTEPLA